MPQRRHNPDTSIQTDRADHPSLMEFLGFHLPDWYVQALCAQTDPEAFFPEKGGSTREAKAVCRRCPVQAECIDEALANEERFGIWGGLSERERRKILRLTTTRPGQHNHLDSNEQESA